VRGLASLVERKNSWQLAEHAGHATPDRLQRLLGSAAWDEAGVREDVRGWTVRFLADWQAVLVCDDTGFVKKGR
jgi:SRSO17 transposase